MGRPSYSVQPLQTWEPGREKRGHSLQSGVATCSSVIIIIIMALVLRKSNNPQYSPRHQHTAGCISRRKRASLWVKKRPVKISVKARNKDSNTCIQNWTWHQKSVHIITGSRTYILQPSKNSLIHQFIHFAKFRWISLVEFSSLDHYANEFHQR